MTTSNKNLGCSIFSSIEARNVKGNGQTPYTNAQVSTILDIISKGVIPIIRYFKKDGSYFDKTTYNFGKDIEVLRTLDKHSEKTINHWSYERSGRMINQYEKIKNNLPCVSWNLNCESGRRLENEDTNLTGYLYFDFDGLEMDVEEAKKHLISKYNFIKAIWVSCGGKGLGGIVKVDGITKELFFATFKYIESLFTDLDVSCKDYTRLNVLSYDPNVLINEDCESVDIEKVKELNTLLEAKKEKNIPKELVKEVDEDGRAVYKLINKTDFANDAEQAHTISFNSCIKKFKGYVKGVRYPFIVKYAGMMNQFGISFDTMSEMILAEIPTFELSHAQKVYRDYSKQFNTIVLDNSSKFSTDDKESVKSLVLKQGQYLSDLGLTLEDVKNKSLIAPTGSGKTYFISSLECKKILLVPTISLTQQFAIEYNGKPFNQDNREVSNDDDFIICTYASYPKLALLVNTNNYNIFVDEAHNFTTSASESFMLNSLSNLLEILKEENYKTLTLITATPVRSLESFLQLEEVKVVREVNVEKNIQFVQAQDSSQFVKNVFYDAKAKDKFVAVLLNDTSSRLDTFLGVLGDYNIQCFSSSLKGEEYFQDLLKNGEFEDNVDGIFSTSVLKEGNNFKVGGKEVDIVVIGNFHPLEVEQFSARFRDASKIHSFILKGASFENKSLSFNCYEFEQQYITRAESFLTTFNTLKRLGDEIPMGFKLASGYETFLKYDELTDLISIDLLKISNNIFRDETSFANSSSALFNTIMCNYDWSIRESFNYGLELNEIDKANVRLYKEDKKAMKEEVTLQILNTLNTMEDFLENSRYFKDESDSDYKTPTELNKDEYTTRYRLNYLFKYVDDIETIKEVFESNNTTTAFNRIKRQVAIKKILNSTGKRLDKTLVRKIHKYFNEDVDYSKQEIIKGISDKVRELIKIIDKNLVYNVSDTSVMSLFRDLFNFTYDNHNKTYRIINTDILALFNLDKKTELDSPIYVPVDNLFESFLKR